MGSEVGSSDRPIHFFFPFMAADHLIPTFDMANLFAIRGCRSTIISIPSKEAILSRSIEKTKNSSHNIDIAVVELPREESGMPQEHGDMKTLPRTPVATDKFMHIVGLLARQLEGLLEEQRPDVLISDMFLPWTTKIADKFGIPWLVFHEIGNFSLGGSECVRLYDPHKKVLCNTVPFVIPNG